MILKTINFIIYVAIFMIGSFGILIASHEVYHYFMVDGEPTGICLGKCSIGDNYKGITNETWVTAAIHWQFTEQQSKRDIEREERDAWVFALIITGALVGLYLYSETK
jgi:hypothetical protein